VVSEKKIPTLSTPRPPGDEGKEPPVPMVYTARHASVAAATSIYRQNVS